MAENTPKIVVGYDASPDADAALTWAAHSAAFRSQPVEVVIAATSMDPVMGGFRETSDETAEQWQAQAFDRLKDLGVVHGTVEIRHGPTVPELVRASAGAAMLVVGSRGHSLAMGTLTGSVSQHVARHAPCPVVTVRPQRSPHAGRIIVGVDGSDEARKALRFAADRAMNTGETVVAVYGHHSFGSRLLGLDGAVSASEVRRMEEADRFLHEQTAGIAADFPDLEIAHEAIPVPPAQVLVDCSAAASLVVVGSRGRDAFTELLLGSVSQHVLHHAGCPVAVVR